LQRKTQRFQL